MSRTLKDAPRRVRAARNKQAEEFHFGCRNDDDPTGRRLRRRRVETTTVSVPAWHEETSTVQYTDLVPVFDEEDNFVGFDDEFGEKEVTRWVFGPETVTTTAVEFRERACRLEGDPGRSGCFAWSYRWQDFGERAPSGLYNSRAARARDRDQLHDLAREFNTFGEVISDDPAIPRSVCDGSCRTCR